MFTLRCRVASGVLVRVVACASLALAAAVLQAEPEPQPLRPPGTNLGAVPKDPSLRMPDFGTSGLTYVTVSGAAFAPASSSVVFDTTGNGYSNQLLRTATGSFVKFAAPIQLPGGAIAKYIELDYCDNTGGSGFVQGALVEMTWDGNPSDYLGFVVSNGDGCTFDSQNTGTMVIDNYYHRYYLLGYVSSDPGHQTGIAGMIVGYQLQVSPAPGSATFGDVPTNHPFFQYIEALAASGITGGCGGGNYCPDNAVTRGQMAVFIAKALGLYYH